MRISDWSSDVCSSDLRVARVEEQADLALARRGFDLFIAAEQGARSRFEPEPVERRALKLRLDPRAKIVGNGEIAVFQRPREPENGRASRRERVCQYVCISGVALSFKKKNIAKK